MKRKSSSAWRQSGNPNQIEFGIIWQLAEQPFKLRAGDVFRSDNRQFGSAGAQPPETVIHKAIR